MSVLTAISKAPSILAMVYANGLDVRGKVFNQTYVYVSSLLQSTT